MHMESSSPHTSASSSSSSARFLSFIDLSGLADVARYVTLTLALGGLQFAWSVETGFGSPYLLSLGLRKSLVSLVWLAGPLSGLITQPLVGILSDNCTSKLGRRRPYIIGATISVVLCLTVVGWTREIAGNRPTFVIWLAVIAFYIMDFAINCIQASLRALVVDTLPASRQDNGTTWASRMIGVGNVCGYLIGMLDLPRHVGFLGSTQMQILTTVASVVLASTVFVTCYHTKETPITRPQARASDNFKLLSTLLSSLRSLPAVIKHIFRIQLFAWIGWFPFLFYSTTYVADLYVSNHGSAENEVLSDEATRAGSQAMFVHAVSSLMFSVVLPIFTYSAAAVAAAAASYSMDPPSYQYEPHASSLTFISRAKRGLYSMQKRFSVSLPKMWTASLCVFALAMFTTLFTTTTTGATLLLGICGLSWAVAIWVPFSLIGEIISSTSPANDYHTIVVHHESSYDNRGDYVQVPTVTGNAIPLENITERGSSELYVQDSQQLHSNAVSAGTVLGLHNVFIVIPQFITAFASSLIFALFEHLAINSNELDDQHAKQIAIVLCFGGISSAVAAYHAWRLSRY
ncbi:major facilitator superfamily domain-containing protein [Coemansia spiralis]|nr:major facilitator superfamily domain-containing protein [Coemansia spiralis]